MQKEVQIQIGTLRLRDSEFCLPLYKKVTPRVAESFYDNIAKLLVDCYREYESSNKTGGEADVACAASPPVLLEKEHEDCLTGSAVRSAGNLGAELRLAPTGQGTN